MKKYSMLIIILVFFYSLAVVMWITTGEFFYFLNFTIIGTCIGLGMGLWPIFPRGKKQLSRLISQVTVGGYLFLGLGCGLFYLAFGMIMPENLQMEGFWFWLFSGIFMAGVIHYSVAKIFGPFLFGRAWCGWTCWTASVLDLLPWKKSPGRYSKRLENLRYIHFFISAGLVALLFFIFKLRVTDNAGVMTFREIDTHGIREYMNYLDIPEAWWFLGGNLFYYASGIILAAFLKDNRAFCKFLCPITVFFKIGSRFSVIKIKKTGDGCNNCMACEKKCPMDVRITGYIHNDLRVSSSECILCQTCISTCSRNVLSLSVGLDRGKEELLNRIGISA